MDSCQASNIRAYQSAAGIEVNQIGDGSDDPLRCLDVDSEVGVRRDIECLVQKVLSDALVAQEQLHVAAIPVPAQVEVEWGEAALAAHPLAEEVSQLLFNISDLRGTTLRLINITLQEKESGTIEQNLPHWY